jgi:hypothetical protein
MRSITIPFEVLWTDVDPLGYAYYPAIFRYVTQAEATLFCLLGFPDADSLAHGFGSRLSASKCSITAPSCYTIQVHARSPSRMSSARAFTSRSPCNDTATIDLG